MTKNNKTKIALDLNQINHKSFFIYEFNNNSGGQFNLRLKKSFGFFFFFSFRVLPCIILLPAAILLFSLIELENVVVSQILFVLGIIMSIAFIYVMKYQYLIEMELKNQQIILHHYIYFNKRKTVLDINKDEEYLVKELKNKYNSTPNFLQKVSGITELVHLNTIFE